MQRLVHGLGQDGVNSVLFCPAHKSERGSAQNGEGCTVRYYRACVPVFGLTTPERRQFVSTGGNLFSFDLLPMLWRERDVQVMHSHTLGRLGAMAAATAARRKLPFVVTIHGGFLDLPKSLHQEFHTPEMRGFDWGRAFGFLLRSRQMLERADAILTCNPKEASLLRQKFPARRVQVQPHGIPAALYKVDSREAAFASWPELRGKRVILSVGRVDSVKNQKWLVDQAQGIFARHADAVLVFAGGFTDQTYAINLQQEVEKRGLAKRILFTGGLSPSDKRLVGLFQLSEVVVLTSISETFGIVLLEAWAAGTPVISSRTSGATALVEHGVNGWLFDLDTPESFHSALDLVLFDPEARKRTVAAGSALVDRQYDLSAIARGVRKLYEELIEAKLCAT